MGVHLTLLAHSPVSPARLKFSSAPFLCHKSHKVYLTLRYKMATTSALDDMIQKASANDRRLRNMALDKMEQLRRLHALEAHIARQPQDSDWYTVNDYKLNDKSRCVQSNIDNLTVSIRELTDQREANLQQLATLRARRTALHSQLALERQAQATQLTLQRQAQLEQQRQQTIREWKRANAPPTTVVVPVPVAAEPTYPRVLYLGSGQSGSRDSFRGFL